jgi:predicted permease
MASFLSDLRQALRALKKSPLFTSVAIASLALGLGANTAIFNLLDQILLRPLPVKSPYELVLVSTPGPARGMFEGDNSDRIFSRPVYLELRDRNQVFSGLAARFPTATNLVFQGQSESVRAEVVSGNFFDVLGVSAVRGRLLSPADDMVKSGHPVVVLGYGFWQRRFGGDEGVLGKTVRVNNSLMTVIGIAPRGFFSLNVGRNPDIYVPLAMKAEMTPTWDRYDDRTAHFLHIVGRLKPGMTAEHATPSLQVIFKPILEADLAALTGDISQKFRERFLAKPLVLTSAHNGVPTFRESAGTPLYILMAMVGLVLLIACANVANLLVARGIGRQKEVAIRLALGASRTDVIRQLLAESLVLAILGAGAGLLVSAWTSSLLVDSIPGDGGITSLNASLGPRTIAFTFAVALITGIAFGLLPAIQATRPNVYPTLKDQGSSVIGGFGQIRSRQALVIAQVALSLLLLFGAGLFTRSLMNLRKLDPGFQTSNMVTFAVDASRNGYAPDRIRETYQRLQEQLASVPGVKSAALNDIMLLGGDHTTNWIRVEGYQPKPDDKMQPNFSYISPGYFSTVGMPLLLGRDFTPADRWGSHRVAIVNETFARHYFHGENPLGRRFGTNREGAGDIEIIGVAKDAKYDSLRGQDQQFVYKPYLQDETPGYITADIRTAMAPEVVLPSLRREVAKVDPNLALFDLETMETRVNESLFAERIIATLCASFGALATLLASIGLYGVTAFSVARRTREIGIRMALGAGRGRVLRMVLREVSWMCLVGVGLGIPLAIGLSRYLTSQLYGIAPTDLPTLLFSAVTMMLVSLLAGILPARRAATVDPIIALRYE